MKNIAKERISLVAVILISLSVLVLTACNTISESTPETEETSESEDVEEVSEPKENSPPGIVSQSGMLEGIIFESGNYLVAVDPNNGEITSLRIFKPEDESVQFYTGSNDHNSYQALQYYNQDLTKKTARKEVSIEGRDGIYEHIGWVNTAGEFEDITAKMESLGDNDTSTGEPLSMHRVLNYRDCFLYAQNTDGLKTYRIPLDNLTPSGLETYQYGYEVGDFDGGDATHLDATGILSGMGGESFYRKLESGSHEYTWPEGHQEIEEAGSEIMDVSQDIALRWVSKDSYIMSRRIISDDYSTAYLCNRTSDNKFTCEAIAPYVEGRINLSYAVSPDNKQIAMLSQQGGKTDLYIGQVDGSAIPKRLEINTEPLQILELDSEIDLLGSKLLCWSDGKQHPQEVELKHYLDTPECQFQIQENIRKFSSDD